MSRFEKFKLPVNKIREYPLVFEAVVPDDCSLFQDVRRYQSVTAHLDVRVINVEGRIELEPGMEMVPLDKLSGSAKREFIEYLRLRITRGDNIGSHWVFFRSEDKKKPVAAFGANVVNRNSTTGQARAIHLLTELQKMGPGAGLMIKIFIVFAAALIAAAGAYYGYRHFIEGVQDGKGFSMDRYLPGSRSPEMSFYEKVFPDIYAWLGSEVVDKKMVAGELLNPEYIKDIMTGMNQEFHRDLKNSDNPRGDRLILFVYFNYNEPVQETLKNYRYKLEGTEFIRLAGIYSCVESGYSSNIFYFKVGDLDVKYPRINQFLTENMISYNDYTRIRDSQGFSEMLEKETINFRLQNFLADVYTFTPLKVAAPIDNIDWYLLIRRDKGGQIKGGQINFAAFFHAGDSTLVPREISRKLMEKKISPGLTGDEFTWYRIDYDQQRLLKLTRSSAGYFGDKIGQNFKLEIISDKIEELGLQAIGEEFPVAVHRELLMEDSKGKYGIQCFDPITSLVLSNVIDKSSFEKSSNVSLKRDPIQINTSLVQLSKDDSTSTQAINITPGKTDVVDMFRDVEQFRGTLANGESVQFERADANLFNPFSFMVHDDSITFSYRHDIGDMEFSINKKILKIVKSADGGYQIVESNIVR
ncbi:MAG: hypothetical protein HQK66_03375 [Desulfamplus sp.]|nr:hypothetical protein [Desulfamplus sp.]